MELTIENKEYIAKAYLRNHNLTKADLHWWLLEQVNTSFEYQEIISLAKNISTGLNSVIKIVEVKK